MSNLVGNKIEFAFVAFWERLQSCKQNILFSVSSTCCGWLSNRAGDLDAYSHNDETVQDDNGGVNETTTAASYCLSSRSGVLDYFEGAAYLRTVCVWIAYMRPRKFFGTMMYYIFMM